MCQTHCKHKLSTTKKFLSFLLFCPSVKSGFTSLCNCRVSFFDKKLSISITATVYYYKWLQSDGLFFIPFFGFVGREHILWWYDILLHLISQTWNCWTSCTECGWITGTLAVIIIFISLLQYGCYKKCLGHTTKAGWDFWFWFRGKKEGLQTSTQHEWRLRIISTEKVWWVTFHKRSIF